MASILSLTHRPGSCDRSLDYAVSLALARHAELHVLHVLPPIPPIPADPSYTFLGRKRYRELLRAQAEDGFESVRRACVPGRALKDLVVVEGDLVRAVAKIAADLKPDFIIVPQAVLRAWSSLFRRRVLERIARAAGAPVVLLPDVVEEREFTCLCCPSPWDMSELAS